MPFDAISICHSYPHTGAHHIPFLQVTPSLSAASTDLLIVIYTFQILLLYMDYVSGIPSTPVVASLSVCTKNYL